MTKNLFVLLFLPFFLFCTMTDAFGADIQKGLEAFNQGDYSKAIRFLKPLAEQREANAQFLLGVMYYGGKGVTRDYEEAAKWLEFAADQGIAAAQSNLCSMYYDGKGVSRNYRKAIDWCTLAAEQGLAEAQSLLGWIYYKGKGTWKYYDQAALWMTRAAEQGLAVSQSNLGLMFLNGDGVAQDDERAFFWLKQAAEQEDVTAQSNLALMYLQGRGTAADAEKAHLWFRRAAEKGLAAAQHRLGMMYEAGRGSKQNDIPARMWYALAAMQKHANAATDLARLTRRMTPSQIEISNQLVAEWLKHRRMRSATIKDVGREIPEDGYDTNDLNSEENLPEGGTGDSAGVSGAGESPEDGVFKGISVPALSWENDVDLRLLGMSGSSVTPAEEIKDEPPVVPQIVEENDGDPEPPEMKGEPGADLETIPVPEETVSSQPPVLEKSPEVTEAEKADDFAAAAGSSQKDTVWAEFVHTDPFPYTAPAQTAEAS